jgi:hypothetical protein
LPQTLVSLVAFVLLVVPGLVFERRRERRRIVGLRSGFRETSEVVLASVVLVAVAGVLVLLLGRLFGRGHVVDLDAYLRDPTEYVKGHRLSTGRTLVATVALASGLAFVADLALAKVTPAGKFVHSPPWVTLTSGKFKPKDTVAYVSIEMKSGVTYLGMLASYELDSETLATRTLVLRSHPKCPIRVRPAGTSKPTEHSPEWVYLVVDVGDIAAASLSYMKWTAADEKDLPGR